MFQKEFQRFEVGAEAIPYVKAQISLGLTLSRLVSESFDFEGSIVSTVMPAHVSQTELVDFECGGKLGIREQEVLTPVNIAGKEWYRVRQSDTDLELAKSLNKYLQTKKTLVIFEDATRISSDDYLTKLNTQMYFVGSEVYHFIDEPQLAQIRSTIRTVRSWMMNGFVVRVGESVNLLLGQRQQLSMEWMTYFARNVEMVLINAYDGEGTLQIAAEGLAF